MWRVPGEEGGDAWNYRSVWSSSVGVGLLCGRCGGWCAYFTDRGNDDSVEEPAVIGAGVGVNVTLLAPNQGTIMSLCFYGFVSRFFLRVGISGLCGGSGTIFAS